MENKPYKTWEEIRKNLNIDKEQEAERQLEKDIIEATINARKKCNLTQRELSIKSGVKQPVIARIERNINSSEPSFMIS